MPLLAAKVSDVDVGLHKGFREVIPSVGEYILATTSLANFQTNRNLMLTGPILESGVSSRRFSMGDFVGSSGGGLNRVGLDISVGDEYTKEGISGNIYKSRGITLFSSRRIEYSP